MTGQVRRSEATKVNDRSSVLLAALLGLGLIAFFAFRAWQGRSATIAILGIGSVVVWEVSGAVGTYLIGRHSTSFAGIYIALVTLVWIIFAWNFQSVARRVWRWWMTKTGRL